MLLARDLVAGAISRFCLCLLRLIKLRKHVIDKPIDVAQLPAIADLLPRDRDVAHRSAIRFAAHPIAIRHDEFALNWLTRRKPDDAHAFARWCYLDIALR